jgi:hypothetical protein
LPEVFGSFSFPGLLGSGFTGPVEFGSCMDLATNAGDYEGLSKVTLVRGRTLYECIAEQPDWIYFTNVLLDRMRLPLCKKNNFFLC